MSDSNEGMADRATNEAGAAELAASIAGARRVVAFTGAGISTESGVPDFRSPGSPWLANMPIPFDRFLADPKARAEGWRRKFAMDDLYRGVAPNRGHRALAHLARTGKLVALITQNIDNLHQASGVPDALLIELHGNGGYARCLDCGTRMELETARAVLEETGQGPLCPACGGLVKSATISFGQSMPEGEMARAKAASLDCDLFLAIGSSLQVYPAAGFPILAKRNGARLVIMNRDPTPLDPIADLIVRGEIGAALAPWDRAD